MHMIHSDEKTIFKLDPKVGKQHFFHIKISFSLEGIPLYIFSNYESIIIQ